MFLFLGCRHLSPGTESAHGAAGGGGGGGQGRAGGGRGGGWGRGRAAAPPGQRPAPAAGSPPPGVGRRRSPWRGGRGSLGEPRAPCLARLRLGLGRPPTCARERASRGLLSSVAEFLPQCLPSRSSPAGDRSPVILRGELGTEEARPGAAVAWLVPGAAWIATRRGDAAPPLFANLFIFPARVESRSRWELSVASLMEFPLSPPTSPSSLLLL